MALISTKLHGAGDYAGGLTMIVAPKLLSGEDRRVRALLRGAGAGMLLASALTDYELGIRRRIPMKANLALDAATGAMLAGAGVALRGRGAGVAVLLRLGALGGGEIAAAALTGREPGDRPGPSEESPPDAASAMTKAGVVADTLLAQEESAAAAEAGRIGGLAPSVTGDPAMDPVYEAGGGDAEGWEAAERQLIENASHDDGRGNPQRDVLRPEFESDASGAVYGEADQIPSTEVVEDPSSSDPDNPAAGLDVGADPGTDKQPRNEWRSRID